MVTDRYLIYNGNGQLTTNEGNFEEVAEFKYVPRNNNYKQEWDAQGN